MKKVGTIVIGILFIIIIGIFLIHTEEENTDIMQDKTKVGMVLNGSINDYSWGRSHYEGLEKCVDELNLEVIYCENVPTDESSLLVIEELVEYGCEIIICNSFGFGEWILKAAEIYPDIYFLHATGTEIADNLSTYFGRMYQMRYLSGIVAGLQTQTNEIGYVAAFPISEVNRGINAFTLGVRKVNPNAHVYVKFSDSWEGKEEAQKATNDLLNHHNIDIIAMHVDTNIPLEIAENSGIWAIGYNYDNGEVYKNSFLTAPIWQWEEFYRPKILECLQDKFYSKIYWQDSNTGILSLAPLTENVKPGIEAIVEKEKKKLESGSWDVFFGPVVDQYGITRIHEGESMTDDAMLNAFDWYVEGVKIDAE
ncbi:MAG: BMP family ABC transporter substrate-binding protein [Lachnospiraceae bacterium]|nr:BMP family ABC transporter substrate-binding protein [Lachnospiraceae bacterium]